ncbi:MAG: aldehyde dehydrogenase family protein [Planctomycetes bacterium]|nr:aldehyde dehydrogenase family protein [Planctomycetota bacterium]
MRLPDRLDPWIAGRFVPAARHVELACPWDGQPFASVAQCSVTELAAAIAAAAAARRTAAALSAHERFSFLRGAARELAAHHDLFASTIARESGKPLREAKVEVDRAIQTLEFSAEEAKRLHGETLVLDAHPAGKGRFGWTRRVPRGVIACITPFNFPLNLVAHKVGPALAAGNTVVVKPAEETPCSAFLLALALQAAGCPDGLVQVVPGLGAEIGEPLAQHPDVAMVSFTGSRAVGTRLRAGAGLKPVTLELGGNAPVVIDDDAEWRGALDRLVAGSFAHSGQVCIHLQRVFATSRRVADEVAAALAERAQALRIGPPTDPASELTALIRERDVVRVGAIVDDARAHGARVATGAARAGHRTYLPTVLEGIDPAMRLAQEELFGPVVAVAATGSFEAAIAAANATRYGLQASVFTRDLERALRAADLLEAGGVIINDVPLFRVDQMPYGGTKESGLGREGPRYACEEMSELKTVVVRRAAH